MNEHDCFDIQKGIRLEYEPVFHVHVQWVLGLTNQGDYPTAS